MYILFISIFYALLWHLIIYIKRDTLPLGIMLNNYQFYFPNFLCISNVYVCVQSLGFTCTIQYFDHPGSFSGFHHVYCTWAIYYKVLLRDKFPICRDLNIYIHLCFFQNSLVLKASIPSHPLEKLLSLIFASLLYVDHLIMKPSLNISSLSILTVIRILAI